MSPLIIRSGHLLYTIRYVNHNITSIKREFEGNREAEYLKWLDLDENLQERIINEMDEDEKENYDI